MLEYKKISFENASGQKIAGRIDMPVDRDPAAYALFAHCFTCTKNLKAVAHISEALTMRGIAVLRFDFTGLGDSEGDFSETNFSSNVDDLVAAADFLKEKFEAPKILIGHSLGGAAVLQAGSRISSAQAVVTIGAPADPSHIEHTFQDDLEKIEKEGKAKVCLEGRPFTIKKQFLDDLEKNQMQDTIRELKKPLLILHSPIDDIVDIENAAKIFKAAFHPKSFISLGEADHLLSRQEDAVYAGTMIAAWSEKYLDKSPTRDWVEDPEDNRIVARIGKTPYRTDILANAHGLVADEPEAEGGENLGPTPYDLLLSALGACTCMTLRMYADRKELSLDAVTVKLNHEKIHAEQCDSCESKKGYLDKIDLRIALEGDLSKDQRKRLLEIANKCPVHRTLHSEIITDATLEE